MTATHNSHFFLDCLHNSVFLHTILFDQNYSKFSLPCRCSQCERSHPRIHQRCTCGEVWKRISALLWCVDQDACQNSSGDALRLYFPRLKAIPWTSCTPTYEWVNRLFLFCFNSLSIGKNGRISLLTKMLIQCKNYVSVHEDAIKSVSLISTTLTRIRVTHVLLIMGRRAGLD